MENLEGVVGSMGDTGVSMANEFKAHIEEGTGKLLGWYTDDVHGSNIPESHVAVTQQEWQDALSINANCYENGKFIVKDFRTAEEITAAELNGKISMANNYLKDTDWVNDYKTRHDLGLELIPEDSSKWDIIGKREEYKAFLRSL